MNPLDGNAIVYCEGAFNTPNGKTAHGLVRFTNRYQILSVVDSRFAGQDAGQVLDGKMKNIPIYASVREAIEMSKKNGAPATHFVVGLAPDGGRLSKSARDDVEVAIKSGLHTDCGLHDFLGDDPFFQKLAREKNVRVRDVRKPHEKSQLHFFSGKIENVDCTKIAVLGTDSAIGKRTTAWLLVHALNKAGLKAVMIGTGQTAWMQGAKYGIILDSLINDFVSGEIEHAVWQAWQNEKPDVIILEGQGSLMNPAYPGGFEILAAGRPDMIVLQHAPARKEYDGFPGYKLHPLPKQIKAVELLSEKPVVAITINHENLDLDLVPSICTTIQNTLDIPTFDVLIDGASELVNVLLPYFKSGNEKIK